jgi:hypothetical protein
MAALATPPTPNETQLYVIHPLDDIQEQKCTSEGLGLMKLTPTVRIALTTLRIYLIAMTLIILYRMATLTHLLPQHAR